MPPRSNLPLLPLDFEVATTQRIASLWSNYGYIHRLHLISEPHSLILKSIHPPALSHPDESHLRKLLSYDIERWFYRHLASRLPVVVKVAKSFPLRSDEEHSLLLEDLSANFPYPASGSLGYDATRCVLDWLAGFHGTFFRINHRKGEETVPLIPPPTMWKEDDVRAGVWQRGTYWYLDTRREELDQTDEEEYKWLLPWVEKINDAVNREIKTHGTFVHGDVKGANIVFSRDPYPRRGNKTITSGSDEPLRCALYDLQYVGLGLPSYDLVYFLGTSVESKLLKSVEDEKSLLRDYFEKFQEVVAPNSVTDYNFDDFWTHWELAIVDWYRFMAGWGCWGNDRWAERRAKEIIDKWNLSELPL